MGSERFFVILDALWESPGAPFSKKNGSCFVQKTFFVQNGFCHFVFKFVVKTTNFVFVHFVNSFCDNVNSFCDNVMYPSVMYKPNFAI